VSGFIEHPPSVTLVVTRRDDLVVVRQRRPGAGRDVWELPAGTLEPGETVHAAADRELAEECGLRVAGWTELGRIWVAPAYSTERATVLAGERSGTAAGTPDPDEEIHVKWIPADGALELLEDATSLAALALWHAARDSAR